MDAQEGAPLVHVEPCANALFGVCGLADQATILDKGDIPLLLGKLLIRPALLLEGEKPCRKRFLQIMRYVPVEEHRGEAVEIYDVIAFELGRLLRKRATKKIEDSSDLLGDRASRIEGGLIAVTCGLDRRPSRWSDRQRFRSALPELRYGRK